MWLIAAIASGGWVAARAAALGRLRTQIRLAREDLELAVRVRDARLCELRHHVTGERKQWLASACVASAQIAGSEEAPGAAEAERELGRCLDAFARLAAEGDRGKFREPVARLQRMSSVVSDARRYAAGLRGEDRRLRAHVPGAAVAWLFRMTPPD